MTKDEEIEKNLEYERQKEVNKKGIKKYLELKKMRTKRVI